MMMMFIIILVIESILNGCRAESAAKRPQARCLEIRKVAQGEAEFFLVDWRSRIHGMERRLEFGTCPVQLPHEVVQRMVVFALPHTFRMAQFGLMES